MHERPGALGYSHFPITLHGIMGGAKELVMSTKNTPTFARDAEILGRLGYKLQFVQPVDKFPQATYIETVSLLKRK